MQRDQELDGLKPLILQAISEHVSQDLRFLVELECLLRRSVGEWDKNFLHYRAPERTMLPQNSIQSKPFLYWAFVYLIDVRVKLEGVDAGILSAFFTLVRKMPQYCCFPHWQDKQCLCSPSCLPGTC